MVAAEDNRNTAALEHGKARLVEPLADLGNLRHVLLGGVSEGLDFGDWRDQVALVDHRQPEREEPFGQPGDAERRRPHVDATPVAAQVQGDADDVGSSHRLTAESGRRWFGRHCTYSRRDG